MPTCPNCGSYIPLGNHSCSCGTTIRYDYDYDCGDSGGNEPELDLLEDLAFYSNKKIASKQIKDGPYKYDFLNELYEKGHNPIFLTQMNNGICEIEEKHNAKLDELSVHIHFVFFNFLVERKCYDAIIRASYDTSYGYNDVELISDIVTPKFEKLYSNEKFKRLILKTEKEINAKFKYCNVMLLADELTLMVYFENHNFFLDDDTVEFVD